MYTVESVRPSAAANGIGSELVHSGPLSVRMAALQRRAPAMAEGGSSDVISVNAPAGSAESVWLTELAQLGISVGEVGATASL